MTGRNLRWILDVEVAFADQPLHEVVEQLGKIRLRLFASFAAQRLEHFRSELAALHQRVENCLSQCVERAVAGLLTDAHPVVRMVLSREPTLQEKIRELVEQGLEID